MSLVLSARAKAWVTRRIPTAAMSLPELERSAHVEGTERTEKKKDKSLTVGLSYSEFG